VGGFEDGAVPPDVARGGEAEAPHQPGEGVGEDVPEEVFANEDAVLFGVLGEPHHDGVNVHRPQGDAGELRSDLLGLQLEHPRGLPQDVGLLGHRDAPVAELLGVGEGLPDDPAGGLPGDDPGGDGEVLPGHGGEGLELGVGGQGLPNLGRRVGPLHAAVGALGALAEDHHVHPGLLETSIRGLADEVEGVSGEGTAGADAKVQVEALAQGHDGAEVDEPLASELGVQLRLGVPLGLAGDGAKEAQAVLLQELHRPVGEGVALGAPEVPADVSLDVVGGEAGLFQDADRLGEDHLADPVPGQRDDGVMGHFLGSFLGKGPFAGTVTPRFRSISATVPPRPFEPGRPSF